MGTDQEPLLGQHDRRAGHSRASRTAARSRPWVDQLSPRPAAATCARRGPRRAASIPAARAWTAPHLGHLWLSASPRLFGDVVRAYLP